MEQPAAPPIAEPTEADIAAALLAERSALAERCGDFVARLAQHNTLVRARLEDGSVLPSLHLDQRWVGFGAMHLQIGLMSLQRAIEQPTAF